MQLHLLIENSIRSCTEHVSAQEEEEEEEDILKTAGEAKESRNLHFSMNAPGRPSAPTAGTLTGISMGFHRMEGWFQETHPHGYQWL